MQDFNCRKCSQIAKIKSEHWKKCRIGVAMNTKLWVRVELLAQSPIELTSSRAQLDRATERNSKVVGLNPGRSNFLFLKTNLLHMTASVHQKILYFFQHKYFVTLFYRQFICVCGRYMPKIYYILQIYNKKIVKTNQRNKLMTIIWPWN